MAGRGNPLIEQQPIDLRLFIAVQIMAPLFADEYRRAYDKALGDGDPYGTKRFRDGDCEEEDEPGELKLLVNLKGISRAAVAAADDLLEELRK